jgi:hypothetical protein
MADKITVIGEIGVSSMYPSMVGLFAGMTADLNGRIAGMLAMSGMLAVQLPSLTAALEAAAIVTAQLTTGGVTLNIAIQAQLLAELEAQLLLILGFLEAFLPSAKAEVFTYDGTAAGFGPAVTGEVGAGMQGGLPSDSVKALVMVGRYPAFFDALAKIMFV